LIPNLTYAGMEVADGGAAGIAFAKMTNPLTSNWEQQRIRNALLSYCSQDTFALYKLYELLS
jgi:hypothetical protein